MTRSARALDGRDARGRSSRAESLTDERRRRQRATAVSQVVLTVAILVFLAPLIWMLSTSLKPRSEVFSSPPRLVGSTVVWSNYFDIWSYVPFGRYMLNGFLVAVAGTALVVLTSLLSAYAFSRLRFRGRDSLFFVFLGTLMVPQEVVVIPMYLFMTAIGWVNTFQALIVPWAFTAFGTFLLRQAMLAVPMELEEAAKVDGASRLRTLVSIITPVVRPTLAVLVVFTFINYWNSFLWPLIVVNDAEHTTVPLGLGQFIGQSVKPWELIMAASTISMLPTVILALVLQRHLVRGISMSSGLGGR